MSDGSSTTHGSSVDGRTYFPNSVLTKILAYTMYHSNLPLIPCNSLNIFTSGIMVWTSEIDSYFEGEEEEVAPLVKRKKVTVKRRAGAVGPGELRL